MPTNNHSTSWTCCQRFSGKDHDYEPPRWVVVVLKFVYHF